MNTIKINNVQFKGQFANAVQSLQTGASITLTNFNNGGWEATSKVRHFLSLLNTAKIAYNKTGNSLRQTVISLGGR